MTTDRIWPDAVGWWPRVGLRMLTDLCWSKDEDMVALWVPSRVQPRGIGSARVGEGRRESELPKLGDSAAAAEVRARRFSPAS